MFRRGQIGAPCLLDQNLLTASRWPILQPQMKPTRAARVANTGRGRWSGSKKARLKCPKNMRTPTTANNPTTTPHNPPRRASAQILSRRSSETTVAPLALLFFPIVFLLGLRSITYLGCRPSGAHPSYNNVPRPSGLGYYIPALRACRSILVNGMHRAGCGSIS